MQGVRAERLGTHLALLKVQSEEEPNSHDQFDNRK
jgi:hypothetical protein